MKRKLFQNLFWLATIMIIVSMLVSYVAPHNTSAAIWKLLFLLLVGALSSFLLSELITQSVTRTLFDSRLEDLETQTVYEELRPLASRILDQNRRIQKQLQLQNTEIRRQYEKQDRMRRDFTANVSHELKTPLTSISGYAEIIRDGLVKTEDISRFAGKIYEETQRLITLVEDILKLSQLDEGHQMIQERGLINLTKVCRRVMSRLQSAAEQREIQMRFSGEERVFTQGTEKIVEEIVFNLVDNAIKYNRPKGDIAVSLGERNNKIVLSVRDSGIGISPEEQERVFERFYRVDKSHSKEIGGTGLGLSIVKHGALYHDARIELDSTLGEGSEFRILFPKEMPPLS